MSFEAGAKVTLKHSCTDARIRGAFGSVFAYTGNGTVWIVLDQPINELTKVKVQLEDLSTATQPTAMRTRARHAIMRQQT